MHPKPPSSLDYDGFLHELALKSWNRAMLEGDAERAETNAKKLAASHDKFWRFVGHIHVSTSRLTRGQATLALDALAEAARVFAESGEIAAIAKSLRAHIHLETHSPKNALAALRGAVATPEVSYWRALAYARQGRREEAVELACTLERLGKSTSNAFASHIRGDLDPESRLASLQRAADAVEEQAVLSPEPVSSPFASRTLPRSRTPDSTRTLRRAFARSRPRPDPSPIGRFRIFAACTGWDGLARMRTRGNGA